MARPIPMRPINWLDSTERAIERRFPPVQPACHSLVERLTALLFRRLPRQLSQDLLELLPPDCRKAIFALEHEAEGEEDASIGYPDFIEKTEEALGSAGITSEEVQNREIADAYLWNVVHEIPAEMKNDLVRALPMELRSRMDLYSGTTDEAKVA